MMNLSNLLICRRIHILCDTRLLTRWFSLCPTWTAFSGLDSPQVEHISFFFLPEYRAHVADGVLRCSVMSGSLRPHGL